MLQQAVELGAIGQRAMFLVWGPPNRGPRSRVFARELGIQEVYYVSCGLRPPLLAPLRYAWQALRTLVLLFRKRPTIVFVQSPPSFAVICAFIYCALGGGRYVVDAHSAAFQYVFWTRPRWLASLLARRATVTIVTNDRFRQIVNEWGGETLVVPDIPTTFPRGEPYQLNGGFNVLVVSSLDDDEPLSEVLQAAASLDGCRFYITGQKAKAPERLLTEAPGNVHFTDLLPEHAYYALMAGSQAVMCLTTRDNTMQRGACEALWSGKPIITSDWPILRSYFHKGAVHVPNTDAGIREGVLRMKRDLGRYQAEIIELQAVQRQLWQERIAALTDLVQAAVARN